MYYFIKSTVFLGIYFLSPRRRPRGASSPGCPFFPADETTPAASGAAPSRFTELSAPLADEFYCHVVPRIIFQISFASVRLRSISPRFDYFTYPTRLKSSKMVSFQSFMCLVLEIFVITPFVIRYFTSRSLSLPLSPASRTSG